MACLVPSLLPKGIHYKQLVQVNMAQVNLSSVEQPNICTYVYLHSPCHQGGNNDIGRFSSIKHWFQYNLTTWNIRMQSHYHMMPFNTVSYINYTKTSKEHAQIQHNKQVWSFLPSRDIIVARLRWDRHIHNVHSLIETTSHCMVLIYCINNSSSQ